MLMEESLNLLKCMQFNCVKYCYLKLELFRNDSYSLIKIIQLFELSIVLLVGLRIR